MRASIKLEKRNGKAAADVGMWESPACCRGHADLCLPGPWLRLIKRFIREQRLPLSLIASLELPQWMEVVPGSEDVGKIRLLPREGFTFICCLGARRWWQELHRLLLRLLKLSSRISRVWQRLLVGDNLHLQHFYRKKWANRPHSERIAFIIDEVF